MARRATPFTPQLEDYLRPYAFDDDQALRQIRLNTDKLPDAGMQISPELGQLLAMFVKLTGGRRVLEVGTFTGYSSTVMARALAAGGRLVCFERDANYLAIAQAHWQMAGVADRIEARLGPALHTLAEAADKEPGTYDLAFIDADKENSLAYIRFALTLLRPGGLVLLDNVFRGGKLADETNTHSATLAMRNVLAEMHQDPGVDFTVLSVGDGVGLMRKREQA